MLCVILRLWINVFMPGMVASDSDLDHLSQQLLSLWPSTMGHLQLSHLPVQSSSSFHIAQVHPSSLFLHESFSHTSGAGKMGVHGPGFFAHHCQVPQVGRTFYDLILAEGCRAMQDASLLPDANIQLLSSGNFSLFLQKLPWLQQYVKFRVAQTPLAEHALY